MTMTASEVAVERQLGTFHKCQRAMDDDSLHFQSTGVQLIQPVNACRTVRRQDSIPVSAGARWKMCASATVVSLKFPLQDPLQAVATTTQPQFLPN